MVSLVQAGPDGGAPLVLFVWQGLVFLVKYFFSSYLGIWVSCSLAMSSDVLGFAGNVEFTGNEFRWSGALN